jgi:hypothetical protein
MGHDISPIGNHKLNTKNIELLAKDISSRLGVNVDYGYFGQKEGFNLLGIHQDDEYILLDKIIQNDKYETCYLTDSNYQFKQLYHKFGDDLFQMSDFLDYNALSPPGSDCFEEEKQQLFVSEFKLVLKASKHESKYMYIHDGLYSNNIPYFSRWWSFCDVFMENDLDNLQIFDAFMAFRKELMHYALAFGGDTVYYLDDQSAVLEGVGQGSEDLLTWLEFEDFVANKTSALMLNIPMFLQDKDYKNGFLQQNKYPLSFIDNFSDIKPN